MRGTLAAAILLLAGLPVAGAEAYRIDDTAGDGLYSVGLGLPPQEPPEGASAVDIVAFDLIEEPDSFTFALTFGRDTTPDAAFVSDRVAFADVFFTHGGQEYGIDLRDGMVYRIDAAGSPRLVTKGNVSEEQEGARQLVRVPRDVLFNAEGATPGVGSVFEGFRAEVTGGRIQAGGGQVWSVDTLPDEGVTVPPFLGILGLEQTGVTRLTAASPTRASNGEAATFVFPFTATNLGAQGDTFRLSWTGVPQGWAVGVAQPVFPIDAGASVQQNLLVSTPFGHQHGAFEDFRLELRSAADPSSLGQADFGIRYHDVPQPAGHHDTLFLHSQRFSGGDPATAQLQAPEWASMNTLEEDPQDLGVAVPADTSVKPAPGFAWRIRLDPSLDIGLQFEPGSEGLVRLPLSSGIPQQGAVAAARLLLQLPSESGYEDVVLATAGPSDPLTMQPDQVVQVELPLVAGGTRHPFLLGSDLYLEVTLTTAQPSAVTVPEYPRLEPGGVLRLPLMEFRDSLDFAATGTSLLWTPVRAVQRIGNPGDVFLYEATLTNQGAQAVDVELALEGVNVGWARLVEAERTRIPAGGAAQVRAVVTIPGNAGGFDVSDVILAAAPVGQVGGQAIVRFLTEVDTVVDRADDANLTTGLVATPAASEAPGLGPALLLAVLAVAVFAARRRR